MIKDNIVYIQHIFDAIIRIEDYTKDISYENFINNNLIQAGVIREIEIIGEASKRLSKDFKEKYNDLPWEKMAGMRDKLIHDYFGVDIDAVWETVKKDIPLLKDKLEDILRKEKC